MKKWRGLLRLLECRGKRRNTLPHAASHRAEVTMHPLRQFAAFLAVLLTTSLAPCVVADLGSGRNPTKVPIAPGSGRDRNVPAPVTYLGVGIVELAPEIGGQLPIDPGTGLLVNEVLPDSPAARAGLQRGDVLARLNGQVLVTPKQLQTLIQNRKPGDQVEVTYFRKKEMRKVAAMLTTR